MYLTSSPSGDRADHEKWLRARRDRVGERGIRRLVRQVPLAGEEPQEGPPPLGDVVADRAAQHRIAGLERGQHRAPREDRKSTRLNSSHGYISYAVFCLKKKTACNATTDKSLV